MGYKLCVIPYIASQVLEITISSDRVIKPTRAEFLTFQQNSLSHLTCPEMLTQNMGEIHVHCGGEPCIACNCLDDRELPKSLARAGDEQFEIERKATDLAMLAWALRSMVNLKTSTVTSSFARHRDMRFARKQRKWEKQQSRYCCHQLGRDPPPERLPECTDWDMELDVKRVNVLVLKALMMAKWKVQRIDQSWWVERECDGRQDDNWT